MILGTGPSGLTAAYRLARHGLHVTLLEQSSRLGGALTATDGPPVPVLGCHRATRKLLQGLGSISELHPATNLSLELQLPDRRVVSYPRGWFPRPLNTVFSLGRFKGFSWRERWNLLSWLEQLWEGTLELTPDLEHRTARDWLNSLGIDQASQQAVWNPVAYWLTGSDLDTLSGDALVTACTPFFLGTASDRRITVFEEPWTSLLVEPILIGLQEAGATVRRETRAIEVLHDHHHVGGIRTADGTVFRADWYISALPHHHLTPLLPERWLTRYAYFQQISELSSRSCSFVRIHVRQALSGPRFILLPNESFRWVWGRPNGIEDSIFSGLLTHPFAEIGDLEAAAVSLLRSLVLLDAERNIGFITQEHRTDSYLSLHPGTKTRRPIAQSPIANFLLAGSWTDTGWPTNMESAIESGERCADALIRQLPS
ncbi:putative Pytoene desaturase [Nitrospira sp. KM1]|nr:putative Pytoene desaturase [Nitrospira sp. KM1]